MNSADANRLEHIALYCSEIAETIDRFGNDLSTFKNDKDYQASISMRLLNIGELVKGLSTDYKDETRTSIQWGAIAGLRDHVAHGYHRLNFEDIFDTATKDIPVLAAFCKKELSKE